MPPGANYSPAAAKVARLDRKPLSLTNDLLCLLNPDTMLPPLRLPRARKPVWTRC
jgi:hypothetical protein